MSIAQNQFFANASQARRIIRNTSRHTIRLSSLALICVGAMVAQDKQLPPGPGKEVLQRVCTACHAVDIVMGKALTKDGWTELVGDMISRGAQGSDDDFTQIVNYLAKNFPPQQGDAAKKVNVNKASADELKSALTLAGKDADVIVEYRQRNGDFKSVEDLKKVPGLDAAKIDAVKDRLIF
jgi:competence protein ComEA